MKQFIKLTDSKDLTPIYININSIESFYPCREEREAFHNITSSVTIQIVGKRSIFMVKETLEEILLLIEAA